MDVGQKDSFESSANQSLEDHSDSLPQAAPKKGPLSFLSGFLTSGLLAWICFGLSVKSVGYFSSHSISYSSPIAQSVASGFKTLVIGMSFLATFSFGFIGLGLAILFIRSLFAGNIKDGD